MHIPQGLYASDSIGCYPVLASENAQPMDDGKGDKVKLILISDLVLAAHQLSM
jgi:hypothetical protein